MGIQPCAKHFSPAVRKYFLSAQALWLKTWSNHDVHPPTTLLGFFERKSLFVFVSVLQSHCRCVCVCVQVSDSPLWGVWVSRSVPHSGRQMAVRPVSALPLSSQPHSAVLPLLSVRRHWLPSGERMCVAFVHFCWQKLLKIFPHSSYCYVLNVVHLSPL